MKKNNDNNCFCYSYDDAEEAKEFYDAFLKAIEKIDKEDNDKLWLPELNEKYYVVHSGDPILASYSGYITDKKRLKANNVFKSFDFANKVTKSTKLHWLLWKLKEQYCPDREFILHKANYALLYNNEEKKWDCDHWSRWDYNAPCFDKESVNKAIRYLNSHEELWKDLI